MKKKVIALLMTVMLCLSLAVPCFATSFSEEEVISRKRAYYPFIDESLSLLYNLRPLAKEAQIDRVFISSTGDYCTPDIIESKRSEASSQNYPVEICIHMNNYNSDGEWIFLNVLANDKLYEFGKFTAYADDISLDVTTAYQSLLNITKGFGILNRTQKGDGFFVYSSKSGTRYLLDIDLNDYQACGYSVSEPTVVETEGETSASTEPQEEVQQQVEGQEQAKEEPAEQYTKDQELIISGKTDFGYFYTYKDSLNYKCFSLTKDGKRFYASVREDLYDYYKNAFQNHSLTLKGKYQFTAEDGSPVVSVSTLVEGTKETNLRSYLWTLNKGTAKNPNFKAYADLKGDGLILSASKDGQSITINSNPWGASKGSQAYQLDNALALIMIKELNSELGLPEWLYTEMTGTRAIDGRQKEVFDYVTVTWSYHPDSGINILYRKNN